MHAKPKEFQKSRWEMWEDAGQPPPMPEIEAGYLFQAFCDSGMTSAGQPMAWPEVEAFARIEGLDAPEAKALRQMSIAYLDGLRLGESPLAISPLDQESQTEPS